MDRAITARLDVARGRVSVLLREEPSYGSLKRQFLSKWQNGANRVSVERIFMVEVRPYETVNRKLSHGLFA